MIVSLRAHRGDRRQRRRGELRRPRGDQHSHSCDDHGSTRGNRGGCGGTYHASGRQRPAFASRHASADELAVSSEQHTSSVAELSAVGLGAAEPDAYHCARPSFGSHRRSSSHKGPHTSRRPSSTSSLHSYSFWTFSFFVL